MSIGILNLKKTLTGKILKGAFYLNNGEMREMCHSFYFTTEESLRKVIFAVFELEYLFFFSLTSEVWLLTESDMEGPVSRP